ncbi:MAG: hypothetical protein A2Y62_17165 [Candidatus Fischerbacteria bacterium RBG_13_37_8]|uniref:Cell division protein FtsL n=1 Tax=Candidatus Fischerbacteria bacterium RBG_13_37_8 TaxID=1817863 RepID=A0A1F5VGJ6_9BACT|nr:MAG: hypothetical protein A2Y62_17165 [Candidatus Fischerbacteria bacterium RBG_13_37_8]
MIVRRIDAAYIQSKQFENEELKKERDPLTFMELFICTISMLIILTGLIFYSWRSLEQLRSQYELRDLENTLRQLKAENQKLILEVEYLSSAERIDQIVVKDMGLKPTELNRIIMIKEPQGVKGEQLRLAKKIIK